MKQWMVPAVASACILAACSADSSSGPKTLVPVCHAAAITQVELGDLAEHKSHGDYVTQLVVDPSSTPGDSIHFTRITDAVNAARNGRLMRGELASAACRISIGVSAGTYNGSVVKSSDPKLEEFPIVIDVPDLTLTGALLMVLDSKGRTTGVVQGAATTLAATPALVVEANAVSQPIFIVNAHPTGSRGDGAVIEGFLMKAGHAAGDTVNGGQGVLSMRVTGLVVRGNRFENGFTEVLDFRATSANVEKNFLIGPGNTCDICLAGPGDYVARDNHLEGPGGIPGIVAVSATLLPVPAVVEQQVLPATSTVTATISNNEIRNHLAKPVGTGLRLGALGIGAPGVIGKVKATLTDNLLVGNTFGLLVEAAFPVASGSLHGDIELTTSGNTMSQICQNSLLVSFSRHTTGLGLTNQPYLRNTTYNLSLGSDFSWSDAWYANPAGLGNTLIVNGATMGNGTKNSYDAAKTCVVN